LHRENLLTRRRSWGVLLKDLSRYPSASLIATFAVALILYGFAIVYANARLTEISSHAEQLQRARLDGTALRLEDYLGHSAQLARVAAVVAGPDRFADLPGDLRNLLRASDRTLVYGVGLFFEPYALNAMERYAIYAYHEPGTPSGLMIVPPHYNLYDYVLRPWYRAALADPGHPAFIGPYVSPGRAAFIGTSETFERNGRVAGVVLVEGLQSTLNRMLRQSLHQDDTLWITDASGRTIMSAGPPHSAQAWVSTTPLAIAHWAIHVASAPVQVQRTQRLAVLWGVPGSLIYWSIVALILWNFNRIRALQLRAIDLQESASREALTGLRNRHYMLDRLQRALARLEKDPKRTFAVLFLDLDRFAVVNDSLGHSAGDELLRAIAERVQSMLPAGVEFGRIGGDEFVNYVPVWSGVGAEALAGEIIAQFGKPFGVGERQIYISASIGIVPASSRYTSADELLRDADTAMYAAKRAGRGRFAVFDDTMREHVLARLSLENDLRRAIENSQVYAYYQPIVDLRTGLVSSAEALARWSCEGDSVSPSVFIPLAEQCGAIESLDAVVLAQACRYAKRAQAHHPGMAVSVNVSASRLHHGAVAAKVRDVLQNVGLAPRHLKIELTETAIMQGAPDALRELHALQELGVQVVIDDFGTGYSSLSYVQRLPISGLKIDRSFVVPIAKDRQTVAIVRAIVVLAKTLGLFVVAEGVEEEAQVEKLREIGVDYAQGFYYSRALDEERLNAYIAAQIRVPLLQQA
jgi:diguanylate cyclase (GGDEF)-like protein